MAGMGGIGRKEGFVAYLKISDDPTNPWVGSWGDEMGWSGVDCISEDFGVPGFWTVDSGFRILEL